MEDTYSEISGSEAEEAFNQLNADQNRKNKRAGGWQAMGLDHSVYKGIIKKGYRQPTPIQRKTIPQICSGRDVVAMSRTGSGKTAAFVIPMLQRLKKRDTRGIRAIIFAPTRELALQSFRFVKELGRYTGLICACLIGGDDMDEQFAVLHKHPDILIATPGRLLHLVIEMGLKLAAVQYVVFDEADRLFEIGLADQLKEIVKRLPETRQTLLFSATLPKILLDFTKAGLSDPVLVRLDVESKLSENLKTVFVCCRANEKLPALLHLCRALSRERQKTIIFCATMKHVELLVAFLQEAGMDPAFLYSQLDPVARKQNIYRFRNTAECSLLVVTDIAARGVDIPLLDYAINWHFPSRPKLFVHRVGRVARAGKTGTSISFIEPDEMAYALDRDLQTKADNGMKKYAKTRPQASAESIRRVKTELRHITPDVHTFFLSKELFPELVSETRTDKNFKEGQHQQHEILKQIKNWRPSQAIFSMQNTLGGKGKFSGDKQNLPIKKELKKPQTCRIERCKIEDKAINYIDYLPKDANTESGLSLQNDDNLGGFESMAKRASLELCADDEKGLYMSSKLGKNVWDRKKKKFVSVESGQPKIKRIRTEDGGWVPVSYKSGRYEKWKQRQNISFLNEEEGIDSRKGRNGRRKSFGNNKNKGNSNNGTKTSKPKSKTEIRSSDQIIKNRRKKARVQSYQNYRKQENLKKKDHRGRAGGKRFGNGRKKSKT
uniref:RNA helicase n=1 Tax=Meloidogyne hapla TaxID=6305 RepID=A0A1I8B6Z1_MELHA